MATFNAESLPSLPFGCWDLSVMVGMQGGYEEAVGGGGYEEKLES